MSIFNRISNFIHYFFDTLKATSMLVKVEHFVLDATDNDIVVVYRLGRQKLLHKVKISKFEREFFEKLSSFDKYRITKFSTLNYVLRDLFLKENHCTIDDIIQLIKKEMENEQLF